MEVDPVNSSCKQSTHEVDFLRFYKLPVVELYSQF